MNQNIVRRIAMSKRVACKFLEELAEPPGLYVAVQVQDKEAFIASLQNQEGIGDSIRTGSVVYLLKKDRIHFTGSDRGSLIALFKFATDTGVPAQVIE